MNVAIIPARGGSKRVPRKNIKPFHGRPIIAYPIEAALASGLFDAVAVSTDDKEIARVAEAAGAKIIIDRPLELADDHTGTAPVVKHAIERMGRGGLECDYACCIYAPTPFVTPEDLEKGYHHVVEGPKQFAFSVTEYEAPIWRALEVDQAGIVRPIWEGKDQVRSQDLMPTYRDAGQWYWGTASAWLREVPLLGPWSVGVKIPRLRAIDIDTLEDWALAEAIYFAGRYPSTAAGRA